jgi:hypothetical protein
MKKGSNSMKGMRQDTLVISVSKLKPTISHIHALHVGSISAQIVHLHNLCRLIQLTSMSFHRQPMSKELHSMRASQMVIGAVNAFKRVMKHVI